MADPAAGDAFRWSALFQRCTDPLFVLNRRRQIVFVNGAWQTLTGLSSAEVRKAVCRRRPDAEPGSAEAVLHVLSPPREALEGRAVEVRRTLAGPDGRPRIWDVRFWPLRGDDGVAGILGTVRAEAPATGQPVLPEKLLSLRQRHAAWYGLDWLVGDSGIMGRLAAQVRLAAQTDSPVLLVGESGSGKRWLARTIHQESPGRERPFFDLACHRLPPQALAWALFGPPALAQRTGATLYLEEPGQLPRELQGRLCEIAADPARRGPRLLASAAADLTDAQTLEAFRCLLTAFTIQVPPLRERPGDLPLLAMRLLERAAADGTNPTLSDEAWELLRAYAWPGNLRELHAVLASAAARADGGKIEASHLPWYLRPTAAPVERTLPLDVILEQVERRLIQLALTLAKGNRSKAAELLAVWRPRLTRRMEALGIEGD
jgi:PAS domain S-box-containing protein